MTPTEELLGRKHLMMIPAGCPPKIRVRECFTSGGFTIFTLLKIKRIRKEKRRKETKGKGKVDYVCSELETSI